METRVINERFVPTATFDFEKYDTIILQSQTGTGKTSNFIKSVKDCKYKVLSLVAKRTLGTQHRNDLEKEFENEVSHYKDSTINLKDHLVYCINSLRKLSVRLEREQSADVIFGDGDYISAFMADRVLFIDEITIFLLTELTRNDTLDKQLKEVFLLFMKLVKTAKKLYVCQSSVDMKAVDIILHQRKGKSLFVDNQYIVNKDKKAKSYVDEDHFVETVLNETDGFLFGCDSKDVVTTLYKKFYEKLSDEDKKRAFLVTSETSMNEYRPQEGDFVFYTPSIIYGVDFTFAKKQNQYIYIKNNNTIDASQCYQQAMRTRNINELRYFVKRESDYKRKFLSILDASKKISAQAVDHKNYLNLCTYINCDDEIAQVENTFSKLYVLSIFQHDVMSENMREYFEDLLSNNGFTITKVNNVCSEVIMKKAMLEKKIATKESRAAFLQQDNPMFTDTMLKDPAVASCFVDGRLPDYSAFVKGFKKDTIYKEMSFEDQKIASNFLSLNLQTYDNAVKYQEFIFNDYTRREFLNFVSLATGSDESNLRKMKSKMENSFDMKFFNENDKLKNVVLITQLAKEFDIDFQDFQADGSKSIKLTTEQKTVMNKLNSKSRDYDLKTKSDVVKFLVGKLNEFLGDKFVSSNRKMVNGERTTNYKINTEVLNTYLELCKLGNCHVPDLWTTFK